jgi:hypothetical protein
VALRHRAGLTGITTFTSSTGTKARVCPSWLGCPSSHRPLDSRRGRFAAAWGGSLEGGLDEVREFCCSRSIKCRTVVPKRRTAASNTVPRD